MLFNSFEFAIFFPLAAGIYFCLPARFRWGFLLVASYAFYMAWEPGYVVLLWISTGCDYLIGRGLEACPRPGRRKAWLGLSLLVNLGLLFFFKYYNFFAASLDPLLLGLNYPRLPESPFLLPVGISFYTFQTLSYSIEVYRGAWPAERHLGRFALYVAFFPQLVAGPIERAQRLLPQFQEPHRFEYNRVVDGLRLMLWGLFKKVVIADRLAVLVNNVYPHPDAFPGPVLALATVAFAFQIYCDFSGYSDIAIGAARVFGIRLMANFQRPYFATSIAAFWRRWHISLSTWFRDYLYFPLGGNRVGPLRWALNIAIVFLISGLWHGAAWRFLIWGGLHGGYLLIGRLTAPARNRLVKVLRLNAYPVVACAASMLFTFLLVCFAWIFFRAASLEQALAVIRGLGRDWGSLFDPALFGNTRVSLGLWQRDFYLVLILPAFLVGVQVLQSRFGPLRRRIAGFPLPVRWMIYSAALWAIFLLGELRQQEFIYFVF